MDNLDKLRGKFITFEGGEGAGKSTQSKKLVEYLNNNNIKAVWTREPGGCEDAEEIRKLLISGSKDRWDGITELLLMYAARRVHTEKKIKPLLQDGVTVISDRYLDSTLAYQGFASDIPIETINIIRNIVLNDFRPDLTVILDLDPTIGLNRVDVRGDKNRFEDKDFVFHQKVREGFDYIFENEKKFRNIVKINVGDEGIDELFNIILKKSVKIFNNI